MKAIIPVAGAGVNLRPHTYTQPKPLIPVAGKPIISFIIDQLLEAGIDDFIFVLGYLGDKIKNYLQSNYPELKKSFVRQEDRRGLGHAIYLTKSQVEKEESIVILLGDTIIDMEMNQFLDIPGSVLATQKVKDPRLFGVVEMDEKGIVQKVVEKPSIPKSNQAIVGLYKIDHVEKLFKALQLVNQRGKELDEEVHLTDALMEMINDKVKFRTYEVSHWYDCGKKEVLLETNRVLLEKGISDVGTQFVFEDSIIIPPVVFGKSCTFSNAIVGPHVTIGHHVHIGNALIADSILGDYVQISDSVLKKSIIGNDAIIKGHAQSLNIGDNNEIDFTS